MKVERGSKILHWLLNSLKLKFQLAISTVNGVGGTQVWLGPGREALLEIMKYRLTCPSTQDLKFEVIYLRKRPRSYYGIPTIPGGGVLKFFLYGGVYDRLRPFSIP